MVARLCQEKPCNCARVGRRANRLDFVSLRLGVYEARDQECNSYGWEQGRARGPDCVLDVEAARNAFGFGERSTSLAAPQCLHIREGFAERTRRFHANARRVGAQMMQSAYRWYVKKADDQALSAYREISSQVMLA